MNWFLYEDLNLLLTIQGYVLPELNSMQGFIFISLVKFVHELTEPIAEYAGLMFTIFIIWKYLKMKDYCVKPWFVL